MKFLLLSLNFAPELTGIGKYSGELADSLVEKGHEVRVVCAPPYYPQWRIQDGHGAGYRVERPGEGLTVYRCPVWIPRKLSGLRRILHLASFALSSLPVLLALTLWQPRVVMIVAPAFFCAPFGWLAARLAGARAWLHIQDFEVDAAFELGLLRRPLVRRFALALERRLLRGFDTVSTISRRMMRQLAAKGVSMDKAELLPNWVDLSVVRPSGPSTALRAELGIDPDKTVCLFSGTINRKQGLEVVIDAARRLRDDATIEFVVCGSGEMRSSLEQAARELPNVRFLDLRPASELNALLNMADIHVLPQLRGAADLVMPSKLAGMLASGRPVVAASPRGTETAVIAGVCGIVTEPECGERFAAAIAALAADPERRAQLGAQGRRYAEQTLDAATILDRFNAKAIGIADERTGVPALGRPPVLEPAVAATSPSVG